MKIAIICVSIYPGGEQPEFALVNKKRLELYSQRHKYDLHYLTDFITKKVCERNKYKWNGFYLIKQMLEKNSHDAYVWIDNDIFIVDMDKRIEDFTSQTPKAMIFSRDHNWTADRSFINMINAGIYILKNTPISKQFAKRAWQMRNFTEHGSRFSDQATINLLLINEFIQDAEILPLGTLQQFIFLLQQKDRPFCIHLAGPSSEKSVYVEIIKKNIYSNCASCIVNEIVQNRKHQLYRTCVNGYYRWDKYRNGKPFLS